MLELLFLKALCWRQFFVRASAVTDGQPHLLLPQGTSRTIADVVRRAWSGVDPKIKYLHPESIALQAEKLGIAAKVRKLIDKRMDVDTEVIVVHKDELLDYLSHRAVHYVVSGEFEDTYLKPAVLAARLLLLNEAVMVHEEGRAISMHDPLAIPEGDPRARPPMPLGISSVDDQLAGGLLYGHVCLILARIGVGKTLVCAHMAAQGLRTGVPVFAALTEVSDSEFARRLRQNYFKLGPVEVKESLEKHDEVLASEELPPSIFYDCRADRDFESLLDRMFRFYLEHQEPALYVIDMFDDFCDTDWQDITAKFRRLTQMAATVEGIVVVTSQVNDPGEKQIRLADVRGAQSKAEKAHVALAFEQDEHQEPEGIMELTILKGRERDITQRNFTILAERRHQELCNIDDDEGI